MKKRTREKIAKTVAVVLAVAMNFMAVSPLSAAARLTSVSDTMSSNKISGTGSAIAGYTESTAAVTEGFIFADGVNDIICFDKDDTASFNATCTGTGNVKVDIISDGGLIGEGVYTGDQVAAAIKTALEAQDGDADDSYTVTYSESTNKFTIHGDGGNTLNTSLGWLTYTGADDTAATFGYTADDNNIRTTAATSDTAVAFVVLNDVNDKFTITIDGEAGAATIDITNTAVVPYVEGAAEGDANTLVAALADAIESDTSFIDGDVTVTYASGKFKITSGTAGENSTIVITEDGTDDFLKTASLVGDTPVDGETAAGIVSANHEIAFTTTTAVAAGEKIAITFPAGFSIPTDLGFADIDMSTDGGGERTLAATADGTHDGVVRTSATVITFTLGSTTTNDNAGSDDVSGNIIAGTVVTIQIGRNAASGVEQIINPTTVGLYKILIETTNAAGDTVIDDAYAAVYLVGDDSVVVTATVDPTLSFSLYGGNSIDFGTLEPNAYHKLGGAQSAYGYVSFDGIGDYADGSDDTQTVTVNSIIYELSDDGVIAATSHAKVDIVDNENNYLTNEQVATNLYRAINNYDGDLVRANVGAAAGEDDMVYVVATQIGAAGNAYTLATTVTGAAVTGGTFTDGAAGYNTKGNIVDYADSGASSIGNGSTGTNITISTNAVSGYVLTVQNTDNATNNGTNGLSNGTSEIIEWTTGTFGYGLLASSQSARYGDATDPVIAAAFRGDGTGDLPEAMSDATNTVASYSGTTAGDNIAIEYNVRIQSDQASGSYADTVTYVLTTTY